MIKIPDEKLEELKIYPVSYRLQQLRWLSGLSQTEFAKLMGCTQATVSTWESGRYTPSGKMILKIIDLYQLPSNFFIDLCIEKVRLQKKRKEKAEDTGARYEDVEFDKAKQIKRRNTNEK